MKKPNKDGVDSKAPGRPAANRNDSEIESLLNAHKTRIKVVGCGGAGNNTLTRLMESGVAGVTAIAANTDAQDLLYAEAEHKILLGKDITNGLGAGSNPEIGERAANENLAEIQAQLQEADLVFVTCGLGGGTGTGSAPVFAKVAKDLGALTIAVVTLPFTEEGVMRWENANRGLEKLRESTDTVIVVQNDKLLEIAPDMPLNKAFTVSDEILANAVKGITELVTEKGLVNLDFADIRAVMQNGGTAMIGLGESQAEEKAVEAVDMAVQNPLLDVDITGAKSALINITGSEDMSLKDARLIMKSVAEKLDPAARVIWGARMDPSMQNALRVMLIVTGLRDDARGNRTAPKAAEREAPPAPAETPPFEVQEPAFAIEADAKAVSGPVFNRMFEEETRADIAILREATRALRVDANNQTPLRDSRNALKSLRSAAELFSFAHVADLTQLVEHAAASLIDEQIPLTEPLAQKIREAVACVQGMIYNDEDALKASVLLRSQLRDLVFDALPEDERPAFASKVPPPAEGVDVAAAGVLDEALLYEDAEAKRGKVGEMVNYVRHLLNDDISGPEK